MRFSYLKIAAVLLLMLALAACGKKAPPRLPQLERPQPPTALSAVHRDTGIMLNWQYKTSMDAISGFHILRSDGTQSERRIATATELEYTDNEISIGTKYTYVIKARHKNGSLSQGGNIVAVTPLAVPREPSDFTLEVVNKGVRLSWSHPRADVLFNVYRSDTGDGFTLRPLNAKALAVNNAVDNPLMAAPVYYRVRAHLGSEWRDEGPASETLSVAPSDFVPVAPTGLKAVVVQNSAIMAWTDNPELWVAKYRIYRSVNGEEFKPVGTSATTAFIDTNKPEGEIRYKVSAIGPVIEGPATEAVPATAR